MMDALRRWNLPDRPHRLLAERYGGNYLPVLLLILILYFLLAVADPDARLTAVLPSFVIVLVVQFGGLGANVPNNRVAMLGVMAAAGAVLYIVGVEANAILLIALGSFLIVSLISIVQLVILRDVVRNKNVSVDTILGSVVAYLLLSFIWAYAYLVLLRWDPDALAGKISGESAYLGETLYFSVVTQTTLGYGDIHPVSGMARLLVQFEALFGQLYIAVLVAWIVGRLVSRQNEASAAPLHDDDAAGGTFDRTN